MWAFRRSNNSTRIPARSTRDRIDGLGNLNLEQQVKGVRHSSHSGVLRLLPDGQMPQYPPAFKRLRELGYTNVQVSKFRQYAYRLVRAGYPLEKGS